MRIAGGIGAALLVTACVASPSPSGGPIASPASSPAGSGGAVVAPADSGRTVATRTDTGLAIVDTGSGRPVAELPAGVPATDWSALYAAKADGSGTTVRALDPRSGATKASASMEGAWTIPAIGRVGLLTGISRDGKRLVLEESAPTQGRTRFAVLSTDLASPPRIVDLKGTFDYDAVSPDGSILYVVEHPDPAAATYYVVRAVDVVPGTLRDAPVVDKRNLDERMAGNPITQAVAPTGWAYTLYSGHEHLFVHGLDTPNAAAVCIDLPTPKDPAELDGASWTMAMRPDGLRLWIASAQYGQIHEIDTVDFRVTRSVKVAATGSGSTAIVASAQSGRLYVGGRDGVTIVEAKGLSVVGHVLAGTAVRDLGMSSDAAELVVIDDDGMLHRLDPADGTTLGSVALSDG